MAVAEMFHLGGWELVVILAMVILLVVGRNLGDLARGLGAGWEEFNKVWRQNARGYEYQTLLAAILVFGFVCFVLVLEMLVR